MGSMAREEIARDAMDRLHLYRTTLPLKSEILRNLDECPRSEVLTLVMKFNICFGNIYLPSATEQEMFWVISVMAPRARCQV